MSIAEPLRALSVADALTVALNALSESQHPDAPQAHLVVKQLLEVYAPRLPRLLAGSSVPMRACLACGRPIIGHRRRATAYCNPACKQRAYRLRKAAA